MQAQIYKETREEIERMKTQFTFKVCNKLPRFLTHMDFLHSNTNWRLLSGNLFGQHVGRRRPKTLLLHPCMHVGINQIFLLVSLAMPKSRRLDLVFQEVVHEL
jgi:hypothetical protein